jgi:Protein of unknown function (DUF3616)
MSTTHTSRCIAFGACAFLSAGAITPALAQTPVFPSFLWTAQPPFADNTGARINISGATCAQPPSRACLAVNDATGFAQLFTLSGTTLRPGPVIPITEGANHAVNTLRAEGAAHDTRSFYVVTTRSKDVLGGQSDSDFLVIRFSADSTGRPPPPTPSDTSGLQVSEKIRNALAAGIPIPQIAGQQITRANANLQGIAVKDGIIHLGFRTPVVSGKSFIVSAPVSAVFGSDPLNLTVHPVAIAPNSGIHDLAAVSDGVLVLAGPIPDLAGAASLFHFNDSTGQLTAVAQFVEPADRKAEALLLLEENPEFFRVLVLFDGVADGGPTEYFIPR